MYIKLGIFLVGVLIILLCISTCIDIINFFLERKKKIAMEKLEEKIDMLEKRIQAFENSAQSYGDNKSYAIRDAEKKEYESVGM